MTDRCENITFQQVMLQSPKIYSNLTWLVTACKRSLGQGNIFTPVCHSVQGGSTWPATPPPHGTRQVHHPSGPGMFPPPRPGRYTPPWPGRYNPQTRQVQPPPQDQAHPLKQIPAYHKDVGATHPTGMFSCSWSKYVCDGIINVWRWIRKMCAFFVTAIMEWSG